MKQDIELKTVRLLIVSHNTKVKVTPKSKSSNLSQKKFS